MKKILALLLFAALLLSCTFCLAEGEELPARTIAPMTFELAEGEERYVENLIFTTDVLITGEYASITFSNCEFLGDITLTANEATRVMLLSCDVYGKCVVQNEIREANMDWPMAKFMSDTPLEVVTNDCVCNTISFGDVPMTIDGTAYSMADAQVYLDPEAGLVPYEGQPSSYYYVAQWWEGGEKTVLVIAES